MTPVAIPVIIGVRPWDIDHMEGIHRDHLNYKFDLIDFNDLKKG